MLFREFFDRIFDIRIHILICEIKLDLARLLDFGLVPLLGHFCEKLAVVLKGILR